MLSFEVCVFNMNRASKIRARSTRTHMLHFGWLECRTAKSLARTGLAGIAAFWSRAQLMPEADPCYNVHELAGCYSIIEAHVACCVLISFKVNRALLNTMASAFSASTASISNPSGSFGGVVLERRRRCGSG